MRLNKPINTITEADLRELITNQVAESKTIEYKESITLSTDSAKKEFLADVSSFANTAGGHIIYGVKEDQGLPIDLPGLAISNVDAEILTLESVIRTGVTPRIPGIKLQTVQLDNGNKALVIYVPTSWSSPHMVSHQGATRFYGRSSNGKYPLDVQDLRQAFILSESTGDRIRDFRLSRIAKIAAADIPLQMSDSVKIVVHIIPMSAFSTREKLDLGEVAKNFHQYFRNTTNRKYNIDGFITFSTGGTGTALQYFQMFRTGQVEYVTSDLASQRFEGASVIASLNAEREIAEACLQSLNTLKACAVEPPFFIIVSLVGVKGALLADPRNFTDRRFDREIILTSEVLLENYPSSKAGLFESLKPAFDEMWNAAGAPGSPNYAENGQRDPQSY